MEHHVSNALKKKMTGECSLDEKQANRLRTFFLSPKPGNRFALHEFDCPPYQGTCGKTFGNPKWLFATRAARKTSITSGSTTNR